MTCKFNTKDGTCKNKELLPIDNLKCVFADRPDFGEIFCKGYQETKYYIEIDSYSQNDQLKRIQLAVTFDTKEQAEQYIKDHVYIQEVEDD